VHLHRLARCGFASRVIADYFRALTAVRGGSPILDAGPAPFGGDTNVTHAMLVPSMGDRLSENPVSRDPHALSSSRKGIKEGLPKSWGGRRRRDQATSASGYREPSGLRWEARMPPLGLTVALV
jgi:hypothetical protein